MDSLRDHSDSPAIRTAGLVVLLFAFAHSYFGVGSIRNALNAAAPEAFRILALAYGSGWVLLMCSALLMAAGARPAVSAAYAGAWCAAAAELIGMFVSGPPRAAPGLVLLFSLARPVSAIYLCTLLPTLTGTPRSLLAMPRSRATAVLVMGGMQPWLAGLLAQLLNGGAPPGIGQAGLLTGLFMTLWGMLPFGVLLLQSRLHRDPAAFWGGLAGTALASMFVYTLIWVQDFNRFLLALLPPVVFAGQAGGIGVGILAGMQRRKDTGGKA
jgi:hypothetical protein